MPFVRKALDITGQIAAPLVGAIHRARNTAPVLLYHRVAPTIDEAYQPLHPDVFRVHCELIDRTFTVLPLRELLDRIRTGRSLRGQCAITFDDGYADFLLFAQPLLAEFRFPVTMFLVTDSLRTGLPPWTYRLNRLGVHGVAAAPAKTALGAVPADERDAHLRELETNIHGDGALPRMLSWDDVRRFGSTDLVSWASHTTSHGFLPTLPRSEMRREIEESRALLADRIGDATNSLSYPNGYCSAEVEQCVRYAGYDAAFAVGQSAAGHADSLFSLPRFDVGWMSAGMMALELTGIVDRVRRLRR